MVEWIEKQFIQNKKVFANMGCYDNLTILLMLVILLLQLQ